MSWQRSLVVLLLLPVLAAQAPAQQRYAQRWLYLMYNLQVEKNADAVIALIGRAKKSGYNGIVLADYKFNILERLPDHYFRHLARVQKAAQEAGIEIIPTVCPIGYSSGLLAHDPDLAEGIPVKNAPFVVQNGLAVLDAENTARFVNGGLEEARGDLFRNFLFQDDPGKASFADRAVVHQGKMSLRMQDVGKHNPAGNCRLVQRVKVRPWACYRFSAWVKTQDLQDPGAFRLQAMAGGRVLSFFDDPLQKTQDWKQVEVVFNSLEAKEILLYAGMWSARGGTLWLDDLALEELALVNVLRRDGCPLTVASADGRITYEEGKDFQPVRDPKLGMVPWAGDYGFNHAGPPLRLTAGSRIKNGERVLVSWYHPILTHSYQVMCCLSEPKVYNVLRDQVKRVNDLLKPRTFFMSHDEIRVANWCRACQERKLTPGQLLADNVRRCVKIIEDINPKAEIVVWSDMFDPHHNAVDKYYLVNGPLAGSWEGLPRRVIIANWNSGKGAQSLKWFAERGHEQIIAGYYDGDLGNLRRWSAAAQDVPNLRGFMYTTWQHRYQHLEEYGQALQGKD